MKIKVNKLIESIMGYYIVFTVIMRNYSMLSRDIAYGISEPLMDIMLGAVCLLYVFYRILIGTAKLSKKRTFFVVLVVVFSIASIVIPGEGMISGLLRYAFPLITVSFYFAFQDMPEKFWVKFANVMAVMAAVSLVLYFLGSVTHIIPPSRTAQYTYFGDYRYCNTYFGLQYESQSAQNILLPGLGYRNCGFFIEAPMYNILLCFAMSAELAFRECPRKKILILYTVTILTTMTTTGVIFLGVMIAVYLFNLGKGKRGAALRLLIVPIIVLGAFFFLTSLMETKLSTGAGSGSVSVRVDHMLAFLKIFAAYPLFGIGYENASVFYKYTLYDQGYSVGLPAMLGRCGIFMFLLYLVPWLQNFLKSFVANKERLYFWAGSFVCLFLTAVVYHPIMIVTLAFQLMVRRQGVTKRT